MTVVNKEIPRGIVTIQALAMPAYTNVYGDIFGGWLVSQMDLAGGILAKQISKGRTVTVAIQSMTFKHPVHVGDVVSCYASLEKLGNTSVSIKIEVWINTHDEEKTIKVTDGIFVYVAVDDNGKPKSIAV